MATIRVSGELARGESRCHYFRSRDPPFDRNILLGDASRVQTLQSVQHYDKRHQDRGG